jgi:uncharacterized membrane protein
MQTGNQYLNPTTAHNKAEASITESSSQLNISRVERLNSLAGSLAQGLFGSRKQKLKNILLSMGGAFFLFRQLSSRRSVNEPVKTDHSEQDNGLITIRHSVHIKQPRKVVYAHWRKLEQQLPAILHHLDAISTVDGQSRYHWKMKLPAGLGAMEWHAVVAEEKENCFIKYRSYKDTNPGYGQLEFKEAPDGRTTLMQICIEYYPFISEIGHLPAKALNCHISKLVQEDLNRFKHFLDYGALPRS